MTGFKHRPALAGNYAAGGPLLKGALGLIVSIRDQGECTS